MNESDWQTARHPDALLEVFRGQAVGPELRRFSVACCRRIRHLQQPCFQNLLAAMESYVQGTGTYEQVLDGSKELQRVADQSLNDETDDTPPLQRFDWDAFRAFRVAAHFDGSYLRSRKQKFLARGETEPGSAYGAAVDVAMAAASSVATYTANSQAGATSDQRVETFLATERQEQQAQAQLVREILGVHFKAQP